MESEAPEHQEIKLLVLASVNAAGRALGLRPGDVLEAFDDAPFSDGVERLIRVMDGAREKQTHVMRFSRSGTSWSVLAGTARLGQWRVETMQRPASDAKPRREARDGLRNWIVMRDPDLYYDVHPVSPTLLGILAPLHLLQMRLYGPLAIWCAVVMCGLPLGTIPTAVLAVLASLYFWLVAPDLFRADRAARGFFLYRIMAARSESDLHRRIAKTDPDHVFILAKRPRHQDDESAALTDT